MLRSRNSSDGGAAFPSRDLIIYVAFGVIFMTLVVQGISLAPLVRRLGLRGDDFWADGDEERAEEPGCAQGGDRAHNPSECAGGRCE